jgi:hypothetical protein
MRRGQLLRVLRNDQTTICLKIYLTARAYTEFPSLLFCNYFDNHHCIVQFIIPGIEKPAEAGFPL